MGARRAPSWGCDATSAIAHRPRPGAQHLVSGWATKPYPPWRLAALKRHRWRVAHRLIPMSCFWQARPASAATWPRHAPPTAGGISRITKHTKCPPGPNPHRHRRLLRPARCRCCRRDPRSTCGWTSRPSPLAVWAGSAGRHSHRRRHAAHQLAASPVSARPGHGHRGIFWLRMASHTSTDTAGSGTPVVDGS